MILKTSLFNKGIYKSTLRRYLWGSVLYFALLFLFTGMFLLMAVDPDTYYVSYHNRDISLILTDGYIVAPMLFAMAVPTITGLLIFRFIHSRKTSVFVHSLPIKRTANYVSSVLAGFTLMAVPVILNSLILMIISASGYSSLFSVGDCFTWMWLNLFCLFTMFSCVCFAASITGNSFAMIAINVLLHCFVLIITAGFVMVSDVFLYGFADENIIFEKVINNTFPVRIGQMMSTWGYQERVFADYGITIAKFGVFALIFYVLGALLYKYRRMETAEDIAGFSCLNHIFKYGLTFIGALSAFALLSSFIHENPFMLWCIVILVSVIIYFGVEMLLKKNFRVWRSYKGYVGFAVCFAVMMSIFAFTSFFGYETYTPEQSEIKSATVYDYYRNEKPLLESDEIKTKALQIHSRMLDKKELVKEIDNYSRIHVEYILENGKRVHRAYPIERDELYEIMEVMYQNQEYKTLSQEVFTPMESVYRIRIHEYEKTAEISSPEKMNELIECIKKDVSSLSYSQIYCEGWGFNVDIEYVPVRENDTAVITRAAENGESIRLNYMNLNINANYKNTLEWIRENGYWNYISLENKGIVYIVREWEDLPFVDDEGRVTELNPEKEKNTVRIADREEIQRLFDYIHNNGHEYISEDDRYYVYQLLDSATREHRTITVMTKTQVGNLFSDSNWKEIN